MSKFYQNVVAPFIQCCRVFSHKNAFCIDDQYYTFGQLQQHIAILHKQILTSKADTIGIIANDHIVTYAAIWATWLAGKAYVPINPNNPSSFNARVTQQLDLDLILDSNTQSPIEVQAEPDNAFFSQFSVADFDDHKRAYVLFTSGSTGVPKGVPILAGNLGSFVENFWAMGYELDENDKGLQMFELTFDLSIMSYLIPLIRGGCIYTVPKDVIKFAYVFELLTEKNISIALMVPSMLKLLRPYFEEIDCDSLKYSLFCGEALHLDIVKEWRKCVPNARIDNVYGPTENTIFCTYYTYDSTAISDGVNGILSIGKPMNACLCEVVDENLNPLEPGQIGELVLAGSQLTPGYLNNSELNDRQFFTMKGKNEEVRYYKSGDLCVKLENGNFNYLGRVDTQVKIQGFRVELSEIEYQAQTGIGHYKNLLCVVQEDKNGNNEIYLVIEDSPFDLSRLKEHLKNSLPAYMIPKEIIFIKKFPLNSSGKTDKKIIKSMIENNGYTFRRANLNDIPYLVHAIIEAEKSGSDIVGIANLFSLDLEEAERVIERILNEEIEGCEFSISSFVIAEYFGEAVGTTASWIEGQNEFEQSSNVIKSNLLARILGIEKMKGLAKYREMLEAIRIPRTIGACQLEFVFISSEHRGKNLFQQIIDYSLSVILPKGTTEVLLELGVYSNNFWGIQSYSRIGFVSSYTATADENAARGILPHHEKLLMQKKYYIN